MAYFPHSLSFLIDNRLRRLLVSPRQLCERLALRRDADVLEIGPGSGYFSVELAGQIPDGRLVLFDLQRAMLSKARRKIERAGLTNVSLAQGDASRLPFPDESFDAAVLVAVLGEVADQSGCLRSLWRVLRPGGTLAFHEHLPDPDFIHAGKLKAIVEPEGFRLRGIIGSKWNYTALFCKMNSTPCYTDGSNRVERRPEQ